MHIEQSGGIRRSLLSGPDQMHNLLLLWSLELGTATADATILPRRFQSDQGYSRRA